jgi:hypothetical protein
MLQREIALLGLLIDQGGMALAEGAALGILARQADIKPSSSRVPRASASQVAQSKPSPVSNILALASSWRAMVLCRLKPGGRGDQRLPTLLHPLR